MMCTRAETWRSISQPWDLLIVGGGITGAGILREAARLGLKALLVEQRDFAWGTSSRSSKLVHGGLRYLKQGKLGLTWASVRERQELLHEGPGLIDPLGFLLSVYKGDFPGRWTFALGLTVYDLLALRWDHGYYSPQDFEMLAPHVSRKNLEGGFRYGDAQTDDARLTLRVLQEACAESRGDACAINYVRAERLLHSGGLVDGAVLHDLESGARAEARARVVINATGAWADTLRQQVGGEARIRPLRGSHLIFPAWRMPLAQAVSFLHPLDRRPVFIFPWEGVVLIGTTDMDHPHSLDEEPAISPEEVSYLMAAVESEFPSLGIGLEDVLSTLAGVRPVIGSGQDDPSKESREHIVWEEAGLLTVTGGKLTTFRLIAQDAIRAVRHRLPGLPEPNLEAPVLDPVNITLPAAKTLDEPTRRRLLGRYGAHAPGLVAAAQPGELEPIPGTLTLWAELRWAARSEQVCHLDDLLLRRTRLALLTPQGGAAIFPTLQRICQQELGWTDERWQSELARYQELWRRCYSLPPVETIPAWREPVRQALAARDAQPSLPRRALRPTLLGLVLAGLGLFGYWLYRRRNRNN
jgi:glycerol-3-phosphate dehydrogenase